jgi:ferredoxin
MAAFGLRCEDLGDRLRPGGEMSRYVIDSSRCIGCGVSTSLAAALVDVSSGRASLLRQPSGAEEVEALETALVMCPVGAIKRSPT